MPLTHTYQLILSRHNSCRVPNSAHQRNSGRPARVGNHPAGQRKVPVVTARPTVRAQALPHAARDVLALVAGEQLTRHVSMHATRGRGESPVRHPRALFGTIWSAHKSVCMYGRGTRLSFCVRHLLRSPQGANRHPTMQTHVRTGCSRIILNC